MPLKHLSRLFFTGLATLGILTAPTVAASGSDPFERRSPGTGYEAPIQKTPLENCFWLAAVGPDPQLNQYFVDQMAIYPSTLFGKLPEGAELTLTGEYPRARYFSYTAYFPSAKTVGTGGSQYLADHDIRPDAGSINPFVDGAARTSKNRYTIHLVQSEPPAAPAPNTIYLRSKTFAFGNSFVMRLYVPDRGTNELGGTALPKHALKLANGTVLEGQAACDALGKFSGRFPFPNPLFKQADYRAGRDAPGKPFGHPATNPPTLRRLWSVPYNTCLNMEGADGPAKCGPNPGSDPNGPGFANPVTDYLDGMIDMRLGEVLVFRGKKPTTVRNYFGAKTFREKGTDMRYYSWCAQESLYSWRISDCVFDEEMPVDKQGFYTVVISRTAYRPGNARYECGFAWLQAPAAGDGFGNVYGGQIFIRHMMQHKGTAMDFSKVTETGAEERALGVYFPKGEYMSKAEFKRRFGCSGG